MRLIAKALNQDAKAAALIARIVNEEIDYNALSDLDKNYCGRKCNKKGTETVYKDEICT